MLDRANIYLFKVKDRNNKWYKIYLINKDAKTTVVKLQINSHKGDSKFNEAFIRNN